MACSHKKPRATVRSERVWSSLSFARCAATVNPSRPSYQYLDRTYVRIVSSLKFQLRNGRETLELELSSPLCSGSCERNKLISGQIIWIRAYLGKHLETHRNFLVLGSVSGFPVCRAIPARSRPNSFDSEVSLGSIKRVRRR